MELSAVTLDDKYTAPIRADLSFGHPGAGAAAADAAQRDRAAGLNTGGFISGYRGSPLGGYDTALWHAKRHLRGARHPFPARHQRGPRGDLGVGQPAGRPLPRRARSMACSASGTARARASTARWTCSSTPTPPAAPRHGGVLCIAGDDHGCQSSTTAHQSEQNFIAAMMPVLNPATVQDYLDFGLLGFALSRFSGCWVGFKAIAETVESSASVLVDPHRVEHRRAADFEMPPGGLNIRWPDTPLEQERRLHGPQDGGGRRLRPRQSRSTASSSTRPRPRLGIVATGKAYLDVRQALDRARLRRCASRRAGHPALQGRPRLAARSRGRAALRRRGSRTCWWSRRSAASSRTSSPASSTTCPHAAPRVVGKTDEAGAPLLPSDGEIGPTHGGARGASTRLARLGVDQPAMRQRLARLESFERLTEVPLAKTQRTPYFCSGCPHNTSTRVPEGSRALAGIGCHFMAQWMPARNTATFSHMGGEGAAWIGQAPFTADKHVFQNLGDGTYQHSGLLAIRAAAAAGVNITYKILYNDAVAMTGGQPVEGHLTVPQITPPGRGRRARKKIVVVTDEPDKYPDGCRLRRRRRSPPPRRARRGAARAARDPRPDRAGLRPDLRRREAPPPQARPLSRSAEARLHQRGGVRGLRRLLGEIELRLGQAARDRVRPQAHHRPVELQQGLLLPQGLLPELRHRPWRPAAPARSRDGRARARSAGASLPPPAPVPSASPTASSSPASAAPASSPSARSSAWRRISRARAARCSTSPASRRRTAR